MTKASQSGVYGDEGTRRGRKEGGRKELLSIPSLCRLVPTLVLTATLTQAVSKVQGGGRVGG